MSDERDELAELIASAEYPNMNPPWAERKDRSPVKYYSRKYADVLIAAGYRKPRTITTVEELDALALDSVILDADDMTLQLDYILDDPSIKFWSQPGSEGRNGNGYVTLPATVLWEPLP